MKIHCIKCKKSFFDFNKTIDQNTFICKECKIKVLESLINWNLPKENR